MGGIGLDVVPRPFGRSPSSWWWQKEPYYTCVDMMRHNLTRGMDIYGMCAYKKHFFKNEKVRRIVSRNIQQIEKKYERIIHWMFLFLCVKDTRNNAVYLSVCLSLSINR